MALRERGLNRLKENWQNQPLALGNDFRLPEELDDGLEAERKVLVQPGRGREGRRLERWAGTEGNQVSQGHGGHDEDIESTREPLQGLNRDFPDGSADKESACNAGDTRDTNSVPRLGRFPGIGNGSPFQYSCLGNPMDRGAWWARVHAVAKNWAHSIIWLIKCSL